MVILANDEQIRSVTLRTLNNGFPSSHPNASITVPLPSLDKQAKELFTIHAYHFMECNSSRNREALIVSTVHSTATDRISDSLRAFSSHPPVPFHRRFSSGSQSAAPRDEMGNIRRLFPLAFPPLLPVCELLSMADKQEAFRLKFYDF
ncbi:unnamed protein product, partial [Mesorhabditis belari]|uniref:Uncharacterized protein n=1 Tax=Mesorhabditis belari TaxID=2138241 RepID=A0AAF3F866_9BILA